MSSIPEVPASYAQVGFEDLIARLRAGDGVCVTVYPGSFYTCAYDVRHDGNDLEIVVRRRYPDEPENDEVDEDHEARTRALYTHIGGRALEQVLAFTPKMIVTRRMENALYELSVGQVGNISYEMLDQLAADIEAACRRPFILDAYGDNLQIDGDHLGIIDYEAERSPFMSPGRQFMDLVRINIGDTMSQRSRTERERRAWHAVYLLGMQVFRTRYPEMAEQYGI